MNLGKLNLLWKILVDQRGAIFYGKRGKLVICDSTKGRDLSQAAPKEVHISNEVSSVHTDITAAMLDPTLTTASICAVNTDNVYVGNLFKFGKVDIDLASPASADGGLLRVEYWDGSIWSAITGLLDGTAVGGNTLRQDGKLQFNVPSNWAKNDVPAAGTPLYYIRFRTTVSTGTDAVAQLIEPSSGQYFEVAFVQFNATFPEGPPRPTEEIRLNRGQLDAAAGYIMLGEENLVGPVDFSFSCWLDDIVNRTALRAALACDNAGVVASWPKTGISTKTDSKRMTGITDALINTPPFQDVTKKTVNVQAMWEQAAGSIYRVANEVYFDPGQITLNEALDSVTLNIRGAVYGSIEAFTSVNFRAGNYL